MTGIAPVTSPGVSATASSCKEHCILTSEKRHDFLLDRHGQFASRAGLLERQLTNLNGVLRKDGGPHKCVLECREAAMAPSSLGREPAQQTLEHLAFADRWISGLFPVLTHQISIQEWQGMLDACSVDHAYGMSYYQPQGEA